VTQVKSVEKDGYNAVQVAFGEGKNLSKAVAGHVKSAGVTPKEIREFRVDELGEVKVGDTWGVTEFTLDDAIDATGISKGKGWAGTIKRHNFKRHRKTHGGKGNTRKRVFDRLDPFYYRGMALLECALGDLIERAA
jgi:large subunit ribosomal protein L3